MKLLLASGYNRSKHSLAVLELLKREGIIVDKCIVVKTFNLKRIYFYFKHLDIREFKKKAFDRIFNKIINQKNLSDEIRIVNNFLSKNDIQEQSIYKYCKSNNIETIKVNNINEPKVISFIDNIDLVVYTGGGILGNRFLNRIGIGVLNCHAGKLPELRGTNVSEWSVLQNIPLANTMHFMVRKIDRGPIISVLPKYYANCKSIDQLRGQATINAIQDLVNTTKDIMSNKYKTKNQKLSQGKQYYNMHPILKNITNAILKQQNGCA